MGSLLSPSQQWSVRHTCETGLATGVSFTNLVVMMLFLGLVSFSLRLVHCTVGMVWW